MAKIFFWKCWRIKVDERNKSNETKHQTGKLSYDDEMDTIPMCLNLHKKDGKVSWAPRVETKVHSCEMIGDLILKWLLNIARQKTELCVGSNNIVTSRRVHLVPCSQLLPVTLTTTEGWRHHQAIQHNRFQALIMKERFKMGKLFHCFLCEVSTCKYVKRSRINN